ncbi:site-specific recombinase XerD [Salinibacter ruber]|jgi:site-specific recombinase XerD|uniref:tyrosine-type recombinase/integrase n=1 Tax=Salinibacter ruber TaxID=146919 RepID=UPI000E58A3E0|nr:tyrosine-type recombinase/integrase [Salinibacter ruber]MCS3685395.1 site-specific recombinase XerD [Salinibacter ruber]MCS3708067.1 site-specific recombinase XerD [Salinibacter ruber]MCS3856438.1 site-specific recombinase XerD [Salinibacter ruber]MCS4142200.1 site-specific recombinase XerD [Salinibacter ruber]MCS4181591.1 site-specific recombinase XerD [Salinibacter ruber]
MSRPDQLPKVLTEEETDRLLSEPNQRYFGPHRDYLYMRIMLKAGLRASEATALRPEHIDLMSGKLMVREGKGAKDRTLWIGEELLEELQSWMDRRKATAGESVYLLPTSKGTQVATSHLRRSVKRYAQDAEIEEVGRVSPHTLRHTFATRLYRSTGKIRLVQKALGHSDLSTTMIYTHVVDEELEGAMKGL